MGELTRIGAPTADVISLDLLKAHCSVDGFDQDELLRIYRAAATARAERFTGRAIMPQTWEWQLDAFPPTPVVLPIGPVAAVTEMATIDLQGQASLLDPSTYRVAVGLTGRIEPVRGWPRTDARLGAVRIRWTAGDGNCPPEMKVAIMMMVGTMFENREDVVTGLSVAELPSAAREMLQLCRVFRG